MNYAESSASEGGSIHGDNDDENWEVTKETKPKSVVERYGPSLSRMAAQQQICSRKSATTQKTKTNTDQKSLSGSSRSHSPESAQDSIADLPSKSSSNQKRKGELTIETHGIKKSNKRQNYPLQIV